MEAIAEGDKNSIKEMCENNLTNRCQEYFDVRNEDVEDETKRLVLQNAEDYTEPIITVIDYNMIMGASINRADNYDCGLTRFSMGWFGKDQPHHRFFRPTKIGDHFNARGELMRVNAELIVKIETNFKLRLKSE